jgi:glycerol uptake facilitator-like aquaporin
MKIYISEGVGTFFLALALYATVSMWVDSSTLYVLLALVLTVLVYSRNKTSNADYNPIISIARRITGEYTSTQLRKYVTAQCIGSVVWILLMASLTDITVMPYSQNIWWGLLFLGIVVCAIFFSYSTLHATMRERQYRGDLFSIIIGISFFLTLLFGASYTWSIFNPALEVSSTMVAVIRHGATIQLDSWTQVRSYQPQEHIYNTTDRLLWISSWKSALKLHHFRIYLLAPLVWGVWWWVLFMLAQWRPFPVHLSLVFSGDSEVK